MAAKILEIYDESGRMVVKQILPPKKESSLSAIIVGISLGLILFVLLLTCVVPAGIGYQRRSKRF